MQASLARGEPQTARKPYLLISLVTNLGLLGFFKYFNFFIDTAQSLFGLFGVHLPIPVMQVILPVGISFYTFQALSYTIDVYRGQLHATRSFWDFFLAVLFFPHLVAGPIQRAAGLIAQVVEPRKTTKTQVVDGVHLIIWGLYKKICIADKLAPIANQYFSLSQPSGGEVLVAVLAFTFQIYCDFSGYTDIARGVAKLIGFEFVLNFNLPYLATNPSDFWRRWHISLSDWLRDYLYVSLGGNRGGELLTYRNLMLTMLLGGLWHGAAWNFVLWGLYHGFLLCAHRFGQVPLKRLGKTLSGVWAAPWIILRIATMFTLTCYGWLLFRATSISQIVTFTSSLARPLDNVPISDIKNIGIAILPLVLVQIIQYNTGKLQFMHQSRLPMEGAAIVYASILYGIIFLGSAPQAFVYFQF